jgi:hypothetical protein
MTKEDNTENMTAFGTFYPCSMIGEWKADNLGGDDYWARKIPQYFKIIGFRKSEYGVHVFIDCTTYDEVPFFVIDINIYRFADFVHKAYDALMKRLIVEKDAARKVAIDALNKDDLVFIMPDGFSSEIKKPFHGKFLEQSTYNSVDVVRNSDGAVLNVHRDQIRLDGVPNEL